jgi:hypothetical protein
MVSMAQPLTREGPAQGEVQIIGVELAASRYNLGEVELDMFACRHTLPASPAGYGRTDLRVTLHTSRGDVTLRGQAPW